MIDVQLHNLVLRVVTLDLKRQHPFIHLSLKRLFAREKKILGQLLCKRRATFDFPAREIVPGGANDTHRIDAHVIVEACVFNRENRVLHHRRNFVVFERDAFLERELTDDGLAVVGVNTSDQAGPVSRQGGDFAGRLRIIQLIRGDDAGQTAGRQGQQQHHGKPKAAQQVFALTWRSADDCLWGIGFQARTWMFC